MIRIVLYPINSNLLLFHLKPIDTLRPWRLLWLCRAFKVWERNNMGGRAKSTRNDWASQQNYAWSVTCVGVLIRLHVYNYVHRWWSDIIWWSWLWSFRLLTKWRRGWIFRYFSIQQILPKFKFTITPYIILCFQFFTSILIKDPRNGFLYYPKDPQKEEGPYAVRFKNYKAHFYTRGRFHTLSNKIAKLAQPEFAIRKVISHLRKRSFRRW